MHTWKSPDRDQREITLNLLRKTLLSIDPTYKIQSEFTQKIYHSGVLDGVSEGTREVLFHQLQTRFGELSDSDMSRLDRVAFCDLYGLSRRVLTAKTLDEALGPGGFGRGTPQS